MEIQEITTQLQSKFGGWFDVSKVTEILKGVDLKGMSFDDIVSKVKEGGLLGDLDGDGVKESLVDEIKGKAGQIFGGMFGK